MVIHLQRIQSNESERLTDHFEFIDGVQEVPLLHRDNPVAQFGVLRKKRGSEGLGSFLILPRILLHRPLRGGQFIPVV